jgi:hypothetical protein
MEHFFLQEVAASSCVYPAALSRSSAVEPSFLDLMDSLKSGGGKPFKWRAFFNPVKSDRHGYG